MSKQTWLFCIFWQPFLVCPFNLAREFRFKIFPFIVFFSFNFIVLRRSVCCLRCKGNSLLHCIIHSVAVTQYNGIKRKFTDMTRKSNLKHWIYMCAVERQRWRHPWGFRLFYSVHASWFNFHLSYMYTALVYLSVDRMFLVGSAEDLWLISDTRIASNKVWCGWVRITQ